MDTILIAASLVQPGQRIVSTYNLVYELDTVVHCGHDARSVEIHGYCTHSPNGKCVHHPGRFMLEPGARVALALEIVTDGCGSCSAIEKNNQHWRRTGAFNTREELVAAIQEDRAGWQRWMADEFGIVGWCDEDKYQRVTCEGCERVFNARIESGGVDTRCQKCQPVIARTPWDAMSPSERDYCRGWDYGHRTADTMAIFQPLQAVPAGVDADAFQRGYADGFHSRKDSLAQSSAG